MYFFFMHNCSFLGYAKIVQLLIQNGADVNAVNEDSNSALIYAAVNGNIAKYMHLHCDKFIWYVTFNEF